MTTSSAARRASHPHPPSSSMSIHRTGDFAPTKDTETTWLVSLLVTPFVSQIPFERALAAPAAVRSHDDLPSADWLTACVRLTPVYRRALGLLGGMERTVGIRDDISYWSHRWASTRCGEADRGYDHVVPAGDVIALGAGLLTQRLFGQRQRQRAQRDRRQKRKRKSLPCTHPATGDGRSCQAVPHRRCRTSGHVGDATSSVEGGFHLQAQGEPGEDLYGRHSGRGTSRQEIPRTRRPCVRGRTADCCTCSSSAQHVHLQQGYYTECQEKTSWIVPGILMAIWTPPALARPASDFSPRQMKSGSVMR